MSTHKCPGCGLVDVERHQLSCKPCWWRLPKPYRRALNAAYHQHGAGSSQHTAALQAVLHWYDQNPKEAA